MPISRVDAQSADGRGGIFGRDPSTQLLSQSRGARGVAPSNAAGSFCKPVEQGCRRSGTQLVAQFSELSVGNTAAYRASQEVVASAPTD